MKGRRAGFTLLEALVTLTLMSVLFGVVASLMRDATILMRQANSDPQTALQTALDPVCADLRCAYKLIRCDNTGVELIRLDSGNTSRLPNPRPTPGPSSFSLHGADASTTIRYFIYNDCLCRDTTYPDTSSETVEVATGIISLDGQLIKPGLVQLSISSQNTGSNPPKLVSFQTLVGLHLPALVMP